MRALPVALLYVALALAGCSGGGDGDPGPTAGTTAPTSGPATTAPSSTPAVPPPNATAPAAPFTMDGVGCQELLVLVPVPIAQARRFVPANYTLLGADAAGYAMAFAGLKHCADLVLDGVALGPASTGDVGVFIDKGEPGVFHYYQAWWATNHTGLWSRLAAQGWHGGVSEDALSSLGTLPAGMPTATLAYANATYALSADVTAAPAQGENRAVGWFDGPAGTVTVDKALRGVRLGSGPATLAGAGEAEALFGASASGTALWNEYGMSGTVGPA